MIVEVEIQGPIAVFSSIIGTTKEVVTLYPTTHLILARMNGARVARFHAEIKSDVLELCDRVKEKLNPAT